MAAYIVIASEAKQSIPAIAALDPAIHPLRTNFLKRDGCAGQAPPMTKDGLRRRKCSSQ
jgi:hypothetical protein